jgi:hypothetical protein
MHIIEILKRIWTRLVFGKTVPKTEPHPSTQAEADKAVAEGTSDFVSDAALAPKTVDEFLLDQSRIQWQFGDWTSLIKITQESLESHPERAKLGLLVAAAHFQIGELDEARRLIALAQAWGCNRRLLSQVLIAGVHNSLGRSTALNGQLDRANLHFESAVRTVSPSSDVRLLTIARRSQQFEQLGILPASDSTPNQIRSI